MTTYTKFDALVIKIEIPAYCKSPFFARVNSMKSIDGKGKHTLLCEYGVEIEINDEQLNALNNGERAKVENVGLVSVFKG